MIEGQDCKACGFMENHKGCKKVMAFVLALIVIFAFVKLTGNDRRNDGTQKDTIVVNGKGELTVKPDVATVSFSVLGEDMDVSKASDAVNTKISKIIDTLKADGVAE